jgi:hypothetical protein
MSTAPVEQITATVRGNQEAASASSHNAMAGFQELAKAYQAIASRNVEKLSASIHQLSSVKSPTEFITLQQKLIKEGIESAVSDSNDIAKLTTAVFSAAFEPMQKQAAALQSVGQNAAKAKN